MWRRCEEVNGEWLRAIMVNGSRFKVKGSWPIMVHGSWLRVNGRLKVDYRLLPPCKA